MGLFGRAAGKAPLGAAVFKRNPDDEDDEDWGPDDPHQSKWADSSYAWRKNPEDSEEDVDEDEDELLTQEELSPSLSPPPLGDYDDDDDDDLEEAPF